MRRSLPSEPGTSTGGEQPDLRATHGMNTLPVSTLTERFHRGTERIRTDQAGVGLGLAIVKSIAQAHDGTLTLTPRASGGLYVTVQLPAAPLQTGRLRSRELRTPCQECYLPGNESTRTMIISLLSGCVGLRPALNG